MPQNQAAHRRAPLTASLGLTVAAAANIVSALGPFTAGAAWLAVMGRMLCLNSTVFELN